MMKIHTLPMGPVQANCYVVIDERSGEAAVVDPGDYTATMTISSESPI